ncbi:zinc-binding dehydrogenase [Streptomyces sp. DSM 41033]|uniref:zinc-binding dehydrogenase n=1 Tax=Streptomyces sp. DSM 41033 TaxID=3448655 RepID=UPI00403FFCFF
MGLAAIQVARQLGAVPLAVTRSGAKKDALLAAGAEAVIATDRDDVSEAAHRHTGAGPEPTSSSTPSWAPAWRTCPRRRSPAGPWSPRGGWTPGPRRSR